MPPPGVPAPPALYVRPVKRPAVLDAGRTALIPLRPLTIGELLDGGFLIVRRNARLMLGLPLVIAGGTAAYVLLGIGLWFLLGNTTVRGAQIALTILLGLVGLFGLVQCLVWMMAVLTRVSLQTVLGEGFAPASRAVTLRSSLPIFWPMVGLSLLHYLAVSVAQTLVSTLYYLGSLGVFLGAEDNDTAAVITLIGLAALSFLLLSVAYGTLSLTIPAYATESRTAPGWIGKPYRPTTVISSFERAFRLIGRRNLLRVMLVFSGAMGVSCGLVVVVAFGVIVMVSLFADAINADVAAVLSNPWTVFGILGVAVLVAMSAVLAYVAAVETLLYLDLRMRREGLDLALRFDCMPIPQPSASPVYYPTPAYPPAPPGVSGR
jgi:hypothetical protein